VLRGVAVVGVVVLAPQLARAEDEDFPDPPLEIAATALYAVSNVRDLIPPDHLSTPIEGSAQGVIVTGEIGYRINGGSSLGAHLSIGTLAGTYAQKTFGVEYDRTSYGLIPIDAGVFFHREMVDQIWGGILLGAHVDGTRFFGDTSWSAALGTGLEVGWDVEHWGYHWISVNARAIAGLTGNVGFGAICIGLGYHH